MGVSTRGLAVRPISPLNDQKQVKEVNTWVVDEPVGPDGVASDASETANVVGGKAKPS